VEPAQKQDNHKQKAEGSAGHRCAPNSEWIVPKVQIGRNRCCEPIACMMHAAMDVGFALASSPGAEDETPNPIGVHSACHLLEPIWQSILDIGSEAHVAGRYAARSVPISRDGPESCGTYWSAIVSGPCYGFIGI
jgi:hypothetical protein